MSKGSIITNVRIVARVKRIRKEFLAAIINLLIFDPDYMHFKLTPKTQVTSPFLIIRQVEAVARTQVD